MKASDRYIQLLTMALPEETPQRDRFLKDMELSLEENCAWNSRTSFLSLCRRFGTPSKAAEEYLSGMGADTLAYRVRALRHRRRREGFIATVSAVFIIILLILIIKSVLGASGYITSGFNYH